MADIERQTENPPWGEADEVRDRLIAAAEHAGANTVMFHLNRGSLPHAMFLEHIRRLAREVLPALQAHEVTRVRLAEDVTVRGVTARTAYASISRPPLPRCPCRWGRLSGTAGESLADI